MNELEEIASTSRRLDSSLGRKFDVTKIGKIINDEAVKKSV